MNLEQIDTSTTEGKAEVMRLAAEGRRVMERGEWSGASWCLVESPPWNWEFYEYAVIRADLAGEGK